LDSKFVKIRQISANAQHYSTAVNGHHKS